MTFAEDLKALCEKHGIYVTGTLKIRTGDNWAGFTVEEHDAVYYGPNRDTTGPFIVCEVLEKPSEPVNCNLGFKGYIQSDISSYDCPVTGKIVEGRKAHRENLKQTGCRILEPGERQNYEKERPIEIERQAEKTADFLSDKIAERWDAPA